MPEESRANNIGTLRLIGALAVLFGHSFVLTEGVRFHDPISDVTREVAGYGLGLPGLGRRDVLRDLGLSGDAELDAPLELRRVRRGAHPCGSIPR